ncbi:MAG: 4-hydroxybutyrate CoA-transferase [Clostridia bacterium]|jgi:acyl-CoA hydrolase|nr:4-hydroxybutyrate CoA-transferase [Clostridia bacterium]
MDWEKLYKERTLAAKQAVDELVKNGDSIFIGGLTVADECIKEITKKAADGNLSDIKLYGNKISLDIGLEDERLKNNLRYYSFFYGSFERNGAKYQNTTLTPIYLSMFGKYMEYIKPDVAVVPMTPPDENGYCNIGPMGFIPAALSNCKTIIAQINTALPRVFGSNHDYHVKNIAAFVPCQNHIAEIESAPLTKTDEKIASYILERIPDGACIQLGIGSMANAVGFGLKDKKHLGVHSEMYTESMATLQEMGVIDNSQKTFMKGRSVSGFCFGNKKTYNYINKNPKIYFLPYEYSNDVRLISQNDNMVSVNSAMSVDLTGQVCAESIGSRQFSASGGQVDFIRGASMSKGGKSFIAFSSTVKTKDGIQSRITPTLLNGAAVTTSRYEVQYIVTEYGIADLKFKDIPTRAKMLINLAHPDFRDELMFEAKKLGYIY